MTRFLTLLITLHFLIVTGHADPSSKKLKEAQSIYVKGFTNTHAQQLQTAEIKTLNDVFITVGGGNRLWNKRIIITRDDSPILRTKFHYYFRGFKGDDLAKEMKKVYLKPGDIIDFKTNVD